MGANYKEAGYASVDEMVKAMRNSVQDHLKAFVSLIGSKETLLTALRNKNWPEFAKIYNGPQYAEHATTRDWRRHMKHTKSRRAMLRHFIFSLYSLGAVSGHAVYVSNAVDYRVLSKQEFADARSRLSPSLVKGFAGELTFDEKQSFVLGTKNGRQSLIIPVHYESEDKNAAVPGHTTPRCGLYLISGHGNVGFVRTAGYDWTEAEACGGLDALGFVANGTEMPRLLLIYSMFTLHDSSKESFVMEWSNKQGLYVGNEKLSMQLEDKSVRTIVGMKQALSRTHRHTSSAKP